MVDQDELRSEDETSQESPHLWKDELSVVQCHAIPWITLAAAKFDFRTMQITHTVKFEEILLNRTR